MTKAIQRFSILSCALVMLGILWLTKARPITQLSVEGMPSAAGIKGGLIVHIGCGDGRLTAALHSNGRYLVHGLDADSRNVERARRYIQSLGIYGKVSIERLTNGVLPYTDNLVNLVIAEELGGVSVDEIMRVLRPNGVAYVKRNGKWVKMVKPKPPEIDDWTHYLHDATNNAVAHDTVVGPPRYLQWVAKPLYCRSHEIDSSISALVSGNGRIFYILDEGPLGITDPRLPSKWSLIARDAFNGVLLWKRPIPHWGWREWKRAELEGKDWTTLRGQRIRSPSTLPRRLVTDGERVFVTLGYRAPVTALDAATGRTIRTYDGTEYTDEILYSDGMLVLCIRRGAGAKAPEQIAVVDADTGKIIWRIQEQRVVPLTLAVNDGRVFFHNSNELVCLDLKRGKELWRTPCKGPSGGLWTAPSTLVAGDGVVLFLKGMELVAVSAETGQILWRAPGSRGPGVANPPDLFIIGGLVWYGGFEGLPKPKNAEEARKMHRMINMLTDVKKFGRDLRTGEVKKVVEVKNLITPGHHFRCYRSKATDRYLLWPKRGVEFIDLNGSNHMRHDWLRAPCKYGVMPSNGLLYVPPHQCFCYPGVKLSGFLALSAELRTERGQSLPRFERGPAYGSVAQDKSASNEDWVTFRHDAKRSGATPTKVPVQLKRIWEVDLHGKLTQPVVADGKVFVAEVSAHTVWCLDATTGKRLWSYIAGGRVDSPPTIYRGLVLFGCADGWVYCLRAKDGKLVWRFRAAPDERRIVAFGQLESASPLHGTVLIKDGIAYVAAGRSSFLDGGIYLYGLNPLTGQVIYQTHVEGPYPDLSKDVGRPFDMDGTKSDVLVTDGTYLYMQQAMFDSTLKQVEAPRITNMGDRKMGRHLLSTAGLLDDSWWNRTFWMYAERWPGYYIANQAPKSGQLLVFNDEMTYGVKCYTRRNCHSPMFFPGKDGYLLFADDNDTEPVLVDQSGNPKPVQWLPAVNEKLFWALTKPAVDRDKGTGFTRAQPPRWMVWVPIRIRAMVLASDILFVAGPPDVLDPTDPLAALNGRKGALLWAVSASDGKKIAEYKLESPPVFDGMIAANGRLFISTQAGRLICMGGNQ